MTTPRLVVVGPEDVGCRLDKFLVSQCGVGRQAAAVMIEQGLVTVFGRRCAKARRLELGDQVSVDTASNGVPEPEADLPLQVRLERPDLVVVDKPAGQPTAPLNASERGTLASALLGRYPEMAGVGYRPREPGLLHRLDTNTSGLVVAARTAECFEHLRALLVDERLDKRYLAIVEASRLPDSGVIDLPLSTRRGPGGQVVVATSATGEPTPGAGAPCSTSFTVVERRRRWALVEVVAKRAYRHQVRAHLAAAGWPIAGDVRYGGGGSHDLPGRHALHASQVAWAGDDRVAAFAVDSPLPEDLAGFLRSTAP